MYQVPCPNTGIGVPDGKSKVFIVFPAIPRSASFRPESIGMPSASSILLSFYGDRLTRNDDTMNTLPACPKCNSEFTYEDGSLYICPECAHEWPIHAAAESADDGVKVFRDSAGNVLQDGDTVSVIK